MKIAPLLLCLAPMAYASDPIGDPIGEPIQGAPSFLAQATGALRWPESRVMVYHNPQGSPLSKTDAVQAIKYAAWSWQQRTGLVLEYAGETERAQIDGAIVIRWADTFQMFIDRNDLNTNAYTRYSYYLDSALLAHATVVLLDSVWQGDYRRGMNTLMHEVGHTLGAVGHSDQAYAVMYWLQMSDRYQLTAADVRMTAYGQHVCHAEITPHGDVYLPGVMGFGVTLEPRSDVFQIKHVHPSGLDCTGELDGDTTTIREVRGIDALYRNATLKQHGDGWQVIGYEF